MVTEIFFVLSGKEFFAIDEKEKGRRSLSGLGGVKEFEAMAVRADRLAAFDGILQSAIQN